VAGLTAMSLPAPAGVEPAIEDPVRPADQTFLTYPEWFLVWSPREYANFIATEPPSAFPFVGHLDQFWSSYADVRDLLGDEFDFNAEYHAMVVVIGTSTTVEYAVKGAYETLLGRPTHALRRHGPTAEDDLASAAAGDYVEFIYETPFYKFDFFGVVADLWTSTPALGPDPLRKWERRYGLTSEYLLKGAYARAIRQSAESSYATPLLTTTVLLDQLPSSVVAHLPDLEVLERRDGGEVLINVPRYQRFTDHAVALAEAGAAFREIAGNRGLILVTVQTAPDWAAPADASFEVLFTQPILTRRELQRVAVTCPVPKLAATLLELAPEVALIEHVYDY